MRVVEFVLPPVLKKRSMAFDVERFASLSKAIDLSDIDWAEVRRVGVTDEEDQVLRYMQDTESHSILYLRDLLTGFTAADPEVTTFLACWVYEETFHGRALDRFLVESGRPSARARYETVHAQTSLRARLSGLGGRLAAKTTPHFAAVHMCWGAINESLAAMAYTQLARRTANEPLRKLLHRVAKDERRHFAFYHDQADWRLRRGGRFAQKLCATLLKTWEPVGTGVGDPHVIPMIGSFLSSDRRGRRDIELVQQAVNQLPGMESWDLVYRSAELARVRYKAADPVAYARHRAADARRDSETAAETAEA
jgi:hypothetical protein